MEKILILLHLFAVIVFLGNIITEIHWLYKATKTGNKEIIRFAITEIIKGDKVFTLPNDYRKAYTSWNFWGWVALLAAALALVLTTIKIPQ